ncbi:uncharacterized protein LOC119776745, partial [Cyprinodon tularosa]|uniref:uncharacterized protein LOC119776745 n=1 Tax=Cyprinodon tularosa TaxID=77115 RepID=UPI0018E24B36
TQSNPTQSNLTQSNGYAASDGVYAASYGVAALTAVSQLELVLSEELTPPVGELRQRRAAVGEGPPGFGGEGGGRPTARRQQGGSSCAGGGLGSEDPGDPSLRGWTAEQEACSPPSVSSPPAAPLSLTLFHFLSPPSLPLCLTSLSHPSPPLPLLSPIALLPLSCTDSPSSSSSSLTHALPLSTLPPSPSPVSLPPPCCRHIVGAAGSSIGGAIL